MKTLIGFGCQSALIGLPRFMHSLFWSNDWDREMSEPRF